MPLRERVKSEFTIDQLLSERNFSLNENNQRRLTHKFGLQNLVVRESGALEAGHVNAQR